MENQTEIMQKKKKELLTEVDKINAVMNKFYAEATLLGVAMRVNPKTGKSSWIKVR
jgi:hypothetical protein